MSSNDHLASPLERRSDPDWEDFVGSRSGITAPGSNASEQIPDSPSWLSSMDEFMKDAEPATDDRTEMPPHLSDPAVVGSGPMSRQWTTPLTGYQRISRQRKGQTKAPTKSIVVITETGTYKSFSPTEFNTIFHVSGSQKYSKPMPITNTFLKCLAIPRPDKGVSSAHHTDIPKSREEFDQTRADAMKTKDEVDKVFLTDGWESQWAP